MDPITLGALITAGITLIGTIITNLGNKRNVSNTNATNLQSVQETNQANSLLAQQQHTWNVQDWQMQAIWESPQHQMQLFRDAGLNPNLIYGQMSDSPSINSTSINPMQANQAIPFLAENPMQGLDPLTLAQSALLRSEANKNNVEADIMQQKLPDELNQLRATTDNLRKQIDEMNQQIAESRRRMQSMDLDDQLKAAQKARIEFQSDIEERQFGLAVKQFEQDVKESNSRINLNSAQRKNFESITALNRRELREMYGTWKYRLAGFDLSNQQIQRALDLSERDIQAADKNLELLGFQIDAGRANSILDQEVNDDLTGKNGLYHYFKTKMNLRLARDMRNYGDSGRFLIRLGK